MAKQEWHKRSGLWIGVLVLMVAGMGLIWLKAQSAEATRTSDQPFSLKACLEADATDVKGLKIVQGSRTPISISNDMVPVICRGRALFENMQSQGAAIEPGSVTFKVVVEYTGEVVSVDIQKTDLTSKPFINQMYGLVANTDFVSWEREDTDTEFIYTAYFGSTS